MSHTLPRLNRFYANLGDAFGQAQALPNWPDVQPFITNHSLASQLSIGEHALSPQFISGQQVWPDAMPFAMAYSGHQFGHFNPNLGDGRAMLLGELNTPDGLVDIHLKGSGATAYSRRGDGRCGLKPALREYLFCEAMSALNIATTGCLGVALTGEKIQRQGIEHGAVLMRTASSHLRVGSFEYAAHLNDVSSLEKLYRFAKERHFPHLGEGSDDDIFAFWKAVLDGQCELVIDWMRVGFIHGVMNTDNCTIGGQTIDYGPCSFMGKYDAHTWYSSIDEIGRYRFGNQPHIIRWNLAQLAQALLPLCQQQALMLQRFQAHIDGFMAQFRQKHYQMLQTKIGLPAASDAGRALIEELLLAMQDGGLDYTQTFTQLRLSLQNGEAPSVICKHWWQRWRDTLIDVQSSIKLMQQVNPVLIPRNHLVEKALQEAESRLSAKPIEDYLAVLKYPYSDKHLNSEFDSPNHAFDGKFLTFCGT